MSHATVLVLGGTGFLGQALIKRLIQEGLTLRAMVRSHSSRSQGLADQGVELAFGDFIDTMSVAAALEGIQHVFHLARGSGTEWPDYLRTDVEPTRRLAELCRDRGIGLFYTSSIAIYDGGIAGHVIQESTPTSAASVRLNAYARAKMVNEKMLADMHRTAGLMAVVFRPGIVIGRGGDPRHPGIGAWPSPNVCRPWGGSQHALPFVLVDDVADAMVRALHAPDVAGESFNLVGDARLSGNAYVDALERMSGATIQRRPLPAWRLFAQSVVKWGLRSATRAHLQPWPSYRYCDGLSCRATYVSDLAKRRLGWKPASDPAVIIEKGISPPVARSIA
jgi:nucleoside-diphosphate-sugar epimerase